MANVSVSRTVSVVALAALFAVVAAAAPVSVFAQEWDYLGSTVDGIGDTNGGYLGYGDSSSWGYLGSSVDSNPSWDYLGSSVDSYPTWDYLGSSVDSNPSWDYLGSSVDGSQWDAYDVYDTYAVYDFYDTYDTYTTYQDGIGYSNQSYGGCGGCGGGGFSFPKFTFSAPSTSYVNRPVTYAAPQQQQQQQQQQQGGQPINIVNNNNNTNTNTNVNTSPVTPVYQAPITYPVQYVYPTYPTYYPTYNYPTYTQPQPYCTITISNYGAGNYGSYGNQLATLSWTSSNATSAYISPNIGSVSTYGSRTVYPIGNMVYTMTVSGPGGSATCQTTSYYTPTYYPPTSPYVSLSQIPYTGLDFGPVGNALYWLSLLSFAAAGAYLLVYYKGGAMVLAHSMFSGQASQLIGRAASKIEPVIQAPVKAVETAIVKTAEKIDSVINLPVAERHGTTDSMVLMHSKDSGAPRIVITRS